MHWLGYSQQMNMGTVIIYGIIIWAIVRFLTIEFFLSDDDQHSLNVDPFSGIIPLHK